ncbi:MAG: MBOAT family protein [Defluviitaleaceae bacterium]|nr:MBOAT family protein [Defluviitaleaceae bacterium]
MSFISPNFFIFLAAFGVCYFLSPRQKRWLALLAASYVFYWFVGGLFAVSVITFTIVTVYASGRWTGSLRERQATLFNRRLPLFLCLTVNFGLLFFFIFSSDIAPRFGMLLIPGISFYTFQAAGYLIDIYRGKIAAEKNILRVALFLSFFPQLVQGPISRHSEIAADLFAGHGWDWERSRRGVWRIIWGYFMWLVIANHAAPLVNTVFAEYQNYGGAVIVFAVFIYRIQIYADFAGGINITLGIAEILGVSLPQNFRQPFFANSLTDFWRRWHITLTRWLRDYLFYPIALSKPLNVFAKSTRKIFGARISKLLTPSIATFCVYFAMGVWHGSGAHIFVFGVLNGAFITAALFLEPQIEKLRKITGIYGESNGRIFAILRTFALMMFLRYFARAESLSHALGMLSRTVSDTRLYELWNGTLLNLGVTATGYVILTFGIIALFTRDILTENGKDCREMLNKAHPLVQFAVLLVMLSCVTLFGVYAGDVLSANFIYAGH